MERPVEQQSPSASTASRDRSPDEIAREIETIRASVAGTLDELRNRVSPGQITDQALDYFRSSGGSEFARNLGRSVRDNPLPILLIGAGIGWLMTSNGRARGHAGELPPPSQHLEGGEARERMSDAAAEAQSRASEMGERALEAAGNVAEATGDRLRGFRDSARSAGTRSGELTHETRHRMQRFGAQAQQRWSRMAEEQPLVLGAIGLALGAALAAGLPATRFENRLMGSASDTVKDKATRTAQHQYEHAKQVASETYEDVAKDLDERGLSSENVADSAASAVKKAGAAADEMAEEAKSDVKSAEASSKSKPSGVEDKKKPGSTASAKSETSAKPENKKT